MMTSLPGAWPLPLPIVDDSMVCATLPVELWTAIFLHMSPEGLATLISLNRVALNMVLDQRYYSVDPFRAFGPSSSSLRTVKFIEHLMEPHIAGRIRELRIEALSMYGHDPATLWTITARVARTLPVVIGHKLDPELASRIRLETLALEFIPKLTNLQSLCIRGSLTAGSLYHNFLSELWSHLAFSRFTPTLKYLDLSTHPFLVMGMPIVDLGLINLTLIESITVNLLAFPPGTHGGDAGFQQILYFLHHSTSFEDIHSNLRVLNITMSAELAYASQNILRELCASINAAPRLEALSVGVHGDTFGANVDVESLSRILLKVAPTLQRVNICSLDFPSTIHDTVNYPFPNLTRLRIYDSKRVNEYFPALLAYDNFFKQSFTHLHSFDLVNTGKPLNFREFRELVKMLSRSSQPPLSKLSVNLVSISPLVFDLLALHFPKMEVLNLQCRAVISSNEDEDEDSILFWEVPRPDLFWEDGAWEYDPFMGKEHTTAVSFIDYFEERRYEWRLKQINLQVWGGGGEKITVIESLLALLSIASDPLVVVTNYFVLDYIHLDREDD